MLVTRARLPACALFVATRKPVAQPVTNAAGEARIHVPWDYETYTLPTARSPLEARHCSPDRHGVLYGAAKPPQSCEQFEGRAVPPLGIGQVSLLWDSNPRPPAY